MPVSGAYKEGRSNAETAESGYLAIGVDEGKRGV